MNFEPHDYQAYVDDTGDADGVYVIRDGEKLPYAALVKDVEPAS